MKMPRIQKQLVKECLRSKFNTPPISSSSSPSSNSDELKRISEAIKNDPANVKLQKNTNLLCLVDLIKYNPYSVPPSSLFSFFSKSNHDHIKTRHHFYFVNLMDSFIRSGHLHDAILCFTFLADNNLTPTPFISCRALLDNLVSKKSSTSVVPTSLTWSFYSRLLDSGYPPDIYKFNMIMHAFCKQGDMKHAHHVFDDIHNRSLLPTAVSFNTLINGYCKQANLKQAFILFDRMTQQHIPTPPPPDVFTYSVLIDALCKHRHGDDNSNSDGLDQANALFKQMCDNGLTPNYVTFTTLINGHCNRGTIASAMDIYSLMLSQSVKPDLITFNTLIHGLCKVSDFKEANKLLADMAKYGMKPDRITYTTLMDGCCKEGNMELALEIRDKMIREGITLDNVAFTTLISGLCVQGQVNDAERTLREMLNADIEPDDATYTMVIDGFCKRGDVKTGFRLLKEMQKDGHIPGVVTYNVLLNGLCKQGQLKNANMLLQAMLNLGVEPDDITYNILIDGQCKKFGKSEDVDINRLRNEKGLVSDYASYTALVNEISTARKSRQRR